MRIKKMKFTWVTALAIVLVCVTLTAFLGVLSGGFQRDLEDWRLRDVNMENVYQSATFKDVNGVLCDGADGLTVKLVDDNAIQVIGTMDTDKTIAIASCTLAAGSSYVFDGDLEGSKNSTYYMTVTGSDGQILATCYNTPVMIAAQDSETVVTISLVVKAEAELDDTLRPILCKGETIDDIVKFYE